MSYLKKWKKHIDSQGLHACYNIVGESGPFRVVVKCYENENHQLFIARTVARTVTSKCQVNYCPFCGYKSEVNKELN